MPTMSTKYVCMLTMYPMQVRVRIVWHVVVKDYVDAFNVHTATKKIRCNEDSLLEIFELLVTRQSMQSNSKYHVVNRERSGQSRVLGRIIVCLAV